MKLSEFDYDLPPSRIAQAPLARRDDSRLMLLERASGRCRHHSFRELADLLRPGDLLVMNDTRVLPARLLVSRSKHEKNTGTDDGQSLDRSGKRQV